MPRSLAASTFVQKKHTEVTRNIKSITTPSATKRPGRHLYPNKRLDLVTLDEALHALATFDERQAQIVELKYFGGMTLDETADVLGVSRVTIKRDWQIARAWLRQQLQ